jgi:1,5-anhydro-D-fructose reductase (1,5-anhydro-D-mannitol-forming)
MGNHRLPEVMRLGTACVTGFYSRTKSRADEVARQFNATGYDELDALLSSDIDAVYIASENEFHTDHALRAAAHQKPILCEKPPALTPDAMKKMIAAAKENRVELGVSFTNRFHELHVQAKKILEEQHLGKLSLITASFLFDNAFANNFRSLPVEKGGGALFDIGIHCIDTLRFLGGDVTTVQGVADKLVHRNLEADDSTFGLLRFQGGHYGQFAASFGVKHATSRIEIFGSKGSLIIEDSLRGMNAATLTMKTDDAENNLTETKLQHTSRKLNNIAKAFQHAIESKTPFSPDGNDGLKALEIISQLTRRI